MRPVATIALLGLLASAGAPAAQELRIGIAFSPQTMDPLHSSTASNDEAALQMFDALVTRTTAEDFVPGLAQSWRQADALTWEFTLRPGVRFHDGTPFTAEHVVASIERAGRSAGPSPYALYVRDIAAVEVAAPGLLRIRTREPFPLLIPYLNRVHIVGDAGPPEPDRGSAAPPPGTGPFRYVAFRPGERLELRRHDGYWGEAPAWERVSFRVVPNASARDAALLAGDLDVIADPGSTTREMLAANPRIALHRAPGNTIVYLGFDQASEAAPRGVRGTAANPFRDPRVREALSIAIDRQAITDRVLRGGGVPAEQPLPPGRFGRPDDIPRDMPNPERARALLAEAGFAAGFEATLALPSDRFGDAAAVGQAVAQMLARIGVRVALEAMPFNVWRSRAGRGEHAIFLNAYGNPHGDASAPIRALTGLPSRETGFGSQNFGGYRNEAQNRLLIESFRETDPARRRTMLEEMTRLTMRDRAILPLHWETNFVASRAGLAVPVRADGMIVAAGIRPR
jgi:peptide/nickel transport system substrate-binding protein